jgi:DNA polymerase (family X)
MTLSNSEIAAVFHAIADSMEILGEDRFRTAAYRRGGEALAELPAPLSVYRASGELARIPGVGKAIADKVAELLDTGKLQFYEKLRARVPSGVLEMLRIPNLGPRSVARLYEERGIASIAALKEAAESGKLAGLKGFGPKTINDILHGITVLEHQPPLRRMMFDGLRAAEQLLAALRSADPTISAASYAGSLRRGRITVGDLDLLAASPDPAATIEVFTGLPLVAEVLSSGVEKATVYLHNGLQADLIAVTPALWGCALQHFTGGRAHNIAFREL